MNQLSEFQIVYATCDQIYKAEEISRILLEKRLIACANIINNVKSLYWWNGAINESAEIIIIAKTKISLIQSVIDEIKSIHTSFTSDGAVQAAQFFIQGSGVVFLALKLHCVILVDKYF